MNPGNFWEDFDSDNKVFSEGDFQGRFGYKVVHFKRIKGTYKISDILSFAQKNDWNLYSTNSYVIKDLISWQTSDNLFFKPSITGFGSNKIVNEFIKVFPRYIDSDFTVY